METGETDVSVLRGVLNSIWGTVAHPEAALAGDPSLALGSLSEPKIQTEELSVCR